MAEIIAATGHRPLKLGGYGKPAEARVVAFAVAYLRRTQPQKTISGMALGWDTAFAKASLELDIPFIAAISFDGQEAKWAARNAARILTSTAARGTTRAAFS